MNTIEDIISYIKEIDSNMSPKKLRYILYLMYADYLIINNQLGDESYKKLFNHLFKVDKNGPMPLRYDSECKLYDAEGDSTKVDYDNKKFIIDTINSYRGYDGQFLEDLACKTLDFRATRMYCNAIIKIIPDDLILVDGLYTDLIDKHFRGN